MEPQALTNDDIYAILTADPDNTYPWLAVSRLPDGRVTAWRDDLEAIVVVELCPMLTLEVAQEAHQRAEDAANWLPGRVDGMTVLIVLWVTTAYMDEVRDSIPWDHFSVAVVDWYPRYMVVHIGRVTVELPVIDLKDALKAARERSANDPSGTFGILDVVTAEYTALVHQGKIFT